MLRSLSKRGGFTLVELLIVIVILSVLAALVVPGVLNQVEVGRTAEAIQTMGRIKTAQENFFALNGGQYYDGTNGASGAGTLGQLDANAYADMQLQQPPAAPAYFRYGMAVTNTATPPTFTITSTRLATINGVLNPTITLDQNSAWGGTHPNRPVRSGIGS